MRFDSLSGTSSRRDMLKVFGGAVAASAITVPVLASEADTSATLRARAKKNLTLGTFTSFYASLSLDEAVRRLKEHEMHCVVCDYAFKDIRFDPLAPDWDVLKKIRAAFEHQKIEFVGLYGYYNVIDPDLDRRKQGEARIHAYIENWKRFGTPVISLETGTFNRQSQFAEDPQNFTEEGYQIFKTTFEKIVRAAEKTQAILAIEPYWRNIICSVERAERLFRELSSPSLKLTMDPCNYFRNEDLPKMRPMLEEIFRRLGPETVLAHAKDVKASDKGTDLPAAGKGVLDYPLYLRLLAELNRPCPLLVEHLSMADVPRARDYVLKSMEKI